MKYKTNPKLKSFSQLELEMELYNRNMIENAKLQKVRETEEELKKHNINFKEEEEYLLIEYDASNLKKYMINKQTATRVYSIVESSGLNAKLLIGKSNRILVIGVNKKNIQLAEYAKLIYLGLDLLANPKLDSNKEIKKVFPDYKFDNEPSK